RKVLQRAARPPEPRVVGDVHDQARPILRKVAYQLGKDAFVADHDAERGWRTREHDGPGTGLQLGNELGPAPDEPDHSRQRHVLAERYEMHLIIAPFDATFGQEIRGVTEHEWTRSFHVD